MRQANLSNQAILLIVLWFWKPTCKTHLTCAALFVCLVTWFLARQHKHWRGASSDTPPFSSPWSLASNVPSLPACSPDILRSLTIHSPTKLTSRLTLIFHLQDHNTSLRIFFKSQNHKHALSFYIYCIYLLSGYILLSLTLCPCPGSAEPLDPQRLLHTHSETYYT